MGLPVREQALYWGIATAVFLLMLWFLGSVILPFLIGGAIAYFLDPVADRLERLGLSRGAATAVISIAALLIFILLSLLVIPTLTQQLLALINAAPEIFNQLQNFLTRAVPADPRQVERRAPDPALGRRHDQGAGRRACQPGDQLGPDGDQCRPLHRRRAGGGLLPAARLGPDGGPCRQLAAARPPRRRSAPSARDIDAVLAGFVRGQLTVCSILGAYYAVALILVGLQFGLIVGVIAGLITFIPYLGALIGGVLAIGLALFQFWGEPGMIAAVVAIFALGQFVEGNILSPNLVGHSVGLHPVWLLFALSAFGTIFGFVGLLVAVPIAATLGVLARFAIRQYLHSQLYKGTRSDLTDV